MGTEHGLLSAMQRAYSLARREFASEIATLSLTPRQAMLLLAVRQSPGHGLKFAAQAIGADIATCSQLVWRLEERGLVGRRADTGDRRRIRLYLTDEADAIVDRVAQARQVANDRVAAAVGDRAEELQALLDRVSEVLSAEQVST